MQVQDFKIEQDSKTKALSIVAAGTAATFVAQTQADAADDVASAVTSITGTMTALAGLASAALAVVLVPFGISYALKFAKRVMSRG